jgi:hypothetical protein
MVQVVERGHGGLAGAGCRYDEVTVAMVAFPLGFQASVRRRHRRG